MKIAVDAMGGDFGPGITIRGAVQACADFNLDVVLVGVESILSKEFKRIGSRSSRITILDAPEAIGMGEGVLSIRRKKFSSIRIGAELVKAGGADAFVSTGNTAAVVYISRKILGLLRGVDKPALAILVPTLKGLSLLLDVGANANCRPRDLEQFAIMGKIFMEQIMGLKNPSIGLMSIGEEESKGNDLTKEAFERLQSSALNFIGNVEGKDLYSGKADIIVSDGFTGNVALKASEGVVETLLSLARREITKNILAKVGFFLMKRNLKSLFKKMDYSEYGGVPLLGLNGVCIIGHGRSNQNAVKNAIGLAKDFVSNRVQEKIQKAFDSAGQAEEGAKA